MPLSELTELVASIDGADLGSTQGRSALAQRIGPLQAMLDRVGAKDSAAQLGVAALLLQRTGDGARSSDEDAKQMVRTLVVAVEQSFHLQPVTPSAGSSADKAPARGAPRRKSEESRQTLRETPRKTLRETLKEARRSRLSELAVVRDMLLGEVLIHFGVLASEEISAALELQRGTGRCLGDILVEYLFTTRDEIKRALHHQKTIRSMIGEEFKAGTASKTAAEKLQAPLPAADRSLGRLRLTTELLLGEVLLLHGTITSQGLERALELQRTSGMLFGEALIQTGAATRADIQRALVTQGKGDRIARGARSRRT